MTISYLTDLMHVSEEAGIVFALTAMRELDEGTRNWLMSEPVYKLNDDHRIVEIIRLAIKDPNSFEKVLSDLRTEYASSEMGMRIGEPARALNRARTWVTESLPQSLLSMESHPEETVEKTSTHIGFTKVVRRKNKLFCWRRSEKWVYKMKTTVQAEATLALMRRSGDDVYPYQLAYNKHQELVASGKAESQKT